MNENSKTIDIAGIIERAGADPEAAEGSQAWALAQVGAAVAELIEADIEFDAAYLTYQAAKTGKPRNDAWDRVQAAVGRRHAALKRVVGGAA